MSEISELVKYAQEENSDPMQEICIGSVPNFQGQQLAVHLRVNIGGARKMINIYGINHVIKKHGKEAVERRKSNEVSIAESDFDLLPNILSDPDSVIRGTDTNRGNPAFKFNKIIKGKPFVVVMTYFKGGRNGAKIEFDTMYIKS